MMKRLIFLPIYLGAFFFIVTTNLNAGITFGSQQSAFTIGSGAQFNVGGSNLVVDGTINQAPSGSLSGNNFVFSNGVLDVGGVELSINAEFDPTAGDTINLNGGNTLRVEPGIVFKTVAVSGTGNVLAGQPTFNNPINLADALTDLTIALQNALNVDINLNGGTLILGDNLTLDADVKINGPGTIKTNGRRLNFGPFYSSSWTTPLTFQDSTGLFLHGTINLGAVWTFIGNNLINGNGSIFAFDPAGQINISGGDELFANDISLQGVGTGSLAFGSVSSKLHFNNAILDISANLTTGVGNVVIDGQTTFVLRDKQWLFNGTGKLSVFDNLWLDISSFTLSPVMPASGNILAPLAVFDVNHMIDVANVTSDITAGNLDITGNGHIQELSNRSVSGSGTSTAFVLSGNYSTNLTLDGNSQVVPSMAITGNLTIDGQGYSILFANSPNPQFIIRPGQTVTLQNVALSNITNNTFQFGNNSKIVIGNNVTWDLVDDVTISKGFIEIPANMMLMVTGNGGERKLIFSPAATGVTQLMHLGNKASLVLKSMELQGLEFIAFEAGSAVALTGDSSVGIRQDTAMNFDIEGTNNTMVLLTDGITLAGTTAFLGNALKNILTIRFSLSVPIEDKVGVMPGNPLLVLAGDPCIYLTNDTDLAILNFDDNAISVQNNSTNAWIIDKNSMLIGNRIEILKNPIKQSSLLFMLKVTELTGQGLDASFARSLAPSVPRKKMPRSAFVQKRARERAIKKEREEARPPVLANKPKAMPRPVPKLGRRKKEVRDLNDGIIDLSLLESRALDLPPGTNDSERYDIQYEDSRVDLVVPIQGNISLNNGLMSNFFNAPSATNTTVIPFNLVLKGNATVIQRDDQEVALQEDTHIINVIGRNNEIQITNTFRVGKNTLFFDENATLKFVLDPGKTLIFEQDVEIDVENNSILEFAGAGTVLLSDGVVISLNGQRAVVDVTSNCPDPVVPDVASRAYLLLSEDVIVTFGETLESRLRAAQISKTTSPSMRRQKMATRGLSAISTHIQGIGEILVDDACLCTDLGGFLHIALEESDDIVFQVLGSGELNVKGNSGFSIGKGCSSLTFDRDGKLSILDGSFEINSDNKISERGCVDKLWFTSGATMFIDSTGLLVLGQNEVQGMYRILEKEFSCKFQPLHIIGDGFVEFVGRASAPERNFTGQLQIPPYISFINDHMTFGQLAGFLTQTVQGLLYSTVYIDQDGKTWVRITKTGISVLLKEGDRIVGDERILVNNKFKVVVRGRDKSNKGFVIDEDGNRS